MENWIYYKIQKNDEENCELLCCIDLETIDDDTPDCEWMWNDGVWRGNIPSYWKVNGEDLTPILNELTAFSCEEWDLISQILAEMEDTVDELFEKEIRGVTISVSYDPHKLMGE